MVGEEKNDLIIKKIREGLNFLDRSIPERTPDISQFRKLVSQVEEKKQERKNRELIIFLFSAALILSVETYTFSLSLTLFVTVQVGALLALPFSIIGWKRLRNRQVNN